jgi:hypothetical protein
MSDNPAPPKPPMASPARIAARVIRLFNVMMNTPRSFELAKFGKLKIGLEQFRNDGGKYHLQQVKGEQQTRYGPNYRDRGDRPSQGETLLAKITLDFKDRDNRQNHLFQIHNSFRTVINHDLFPQNDLSKSEKSFR